MKKMCEPFAWSMLFCVERKPCSPHSPSAVMRASSSGFADSLMLLRCSRATAMRSGF